jgi:hypothetical protein
MKKILAYVLVGSAPLLAFAQASLASLLDDVRYYIDVALPLLVSLAVVWFVWQVIRYTISGDEDKKKEAKSGIIWGIVGLFVIVSVWGLVGFLSNTLGIGQGGGVRLPQLPY